MKKEPVKERATTDHLGFLLLQNARLNRDTAFTAEERKTLQLVGLLPPVEGTLDDQVKRMNMQLKLKPNDLERYIYLISLNDRNIVDVVLQFL